MQITKFRSKNAAILLLSVLSTLCIFALFWNLRHTVSKSISELIHPKFEYVSTTSEDKLTTEIKDQNVPKLNHLSQSISILDERMQLASERLLHAELDLYATRKTANPNSTKTFQPQVQHHRKFEIPPEVLQTRKAVANLRSLSEWVSTVHVPPTFDEPKVGDVTIQAILKLPYEPLESYALAEKSYLHYKTDLTKQTLITTYNSPLLRKCAVKIRTSRVMIISSSGQEAVKVGVNFSPESKYVMLPKDQHTMCIWDLEGNPIKEIQEKKRNIINGIYSPDGKYILMIYDDKFGRLYQPNTAYTKILKGHKHNLICGAFSTDSKYILTTSYDQTTRVWDLEGNNMLTLGGHLEPVKKAEFSINNNLILTGSYDNTVRLWNIKGTELVTVRIENEFYVDNYFVPQKENFVVITDKFARVFDTKGNILTEAPNATFKFSQDGNSFITIFKNQLVYTNEHGISRKISRGNTGWLDAADISPDGKFIASNAHNLIKVWDIIRSKEVLVLNGHNRRVDDLKFSPDSKYLISTATDGTSRFWLLDPELIIEKAKALQEEKSM